MCRSVLSGSMETSLRFPSTKIKGNANYTLFHVARYNDSAVYVPGPFGSCNRMIGTSGFDNWWSGFYACRQTIAYHYKGVVGPSDWVYAADVDVSSGPSKYKWVISSDMATQYRSDGVVRGKEATEGSAPGQDLLINPGWGDGEYSHWLFAEVRGGRGWR